MPSLVPGMDLIVKRRVLVQISLSAFACPASIRQTRTYTRFMPLKVWPTGKDLGASRFNSAKMCGKIKRASARKVYAKHLPFYAAPFLYNIRYVNL